MPINIGARPGGSQAAGAASDPAAQRRLAVGRTLCYLCGVKIAQSGTGEEVLALFQTLRLPVFVIDGTGAVVSCNEGLVAALASDPASVVGRNIREFLTPEPRADAGLSGAACTRRDGSSFPTTVGVAPVPGDAGLRLVVLRDAPRPRSTVPGEPRTAEDAARAAPPGVINELSGIINSSLSIGTIFRMVVKELRNLIDYSRASLLLYREERDDLLIFALDTEMPTEMKKGVLAPMEGTSAGWVVRNNKPWISHDLQRTPFALDRKLLAEGIRSTISIPLSHDRMLGVFNFDSTVPGLYAERDLELLLPVAKHIAIALENAILFEEISREKKEWERTFDAITDMVWIEDGQRRVIRANRTLLQKTGFGASEITSRHCGELLERLGIAGTRCLCDETRAGRRPSSQEFKTAAGGIFQFWAYPLTDEEGKLYAIVHYLKDVSGQRRLEQQLIRSDRLASLGTLVAGIAHEINNPLGIIAGYAEALLDRADDPELRAVGEFEDFPEYLRTIHHEIFRCKSILQSLLEFARPSGGTFREIDINELIKEVLLLLQHRTARLQRRIDLRLTRELPKISADAGSLRQVLMNLLLNAIYFTPEGGGITIATEADAAPARQGLAECGSRIRLTVRDSGTGIAPEVAGKIFDPFFTTKPVGEGTGLGLTISHRIIEEHGGSIDVESAPGEGTAFVITLPSAAP
jgi:two-component system NtrC family sensor kinase